MTVPHLTIQNVYSPAPREAWRSILEASEEALPFHTPEWLDCICEIEPYADTSRLYELSDGTRALVPLVRRRGLPRVAALEASFPLGWGFGGIVTPGKLNPQIIAPVLADLERHAGLRLSVRPNPLTADAWERAVPPSFTRVARYAHVLELESDFERFWSQGVPKTTRRMARRAEQDGVEVQSDATGRLIPTFYDLYLRSVERWAAAEGRDPRAAVRRAERTEPLGKLQLVAERFGPRCRVWLATVGDRPAAATIVLYGTHSLCDWRGAMDKEVAGPTQANYALHRHSIQHACQVGVRFYHMGESAEGDSLAFFKTRFGAVGHHYTEPRLERLPITGARSAALALARRARAWRRAGTLVEGSPA